MQFQDKGEVCQKFPPQVVVLVALEVVGRLPFEVVGRLPLEVALVAMVVGRLLAVENLSRHRLDLDLVCQGLHNIG